MTTVDETRHTTATWLAVVALAAVAVLVMLTFLSGKAGDSASDTSPPAGHAGAVATFDPSDRPSGEPPTTAPTATPTTAPTPAPQPDPTAAETLPTSEPAAPEAPATEATTEPAGQPENLVPVTLPPSLTGAEWDRIPTQRRVVALTFDAGSNADAVPSILATLKKRAARATFFLTGSWTRLYPEQASSIIRRYPVGNHSNTHPDFTTLSNRQIRRQIGRTDRAIATAGGRDPRPLFRFPYGARDDRTIEAVNRLGYGSIRWTIDTLGWKGTDAGMTTRRVVGRVADGLTPGAIILMHVGSNPDDGSMLDAKALGQVISTVRDEGYRLVSLRGALRLIGANPGDVARRESDALRRGDRGAAVGDLQTRLVEQHYFLGDIDGHYGYLTEQAVTAFQKVHGLDADGVAGTSTMDALDDPLAPTARTTEGVAVEVHQDKQIVLLVRRGTVQHIFNASSGTPMTPTPSGSYRIYREIDGWRTSPLGRLYRPKYFYRGYALHGSTSVPPARASHGCVRINLASADFLWPMVPVGTPLSVFPP
jgi:peptidoglycan/xylan/chitin deacetylase (PgdA/CDA1 family)